MKEQEQNEKDSEKKKLSTFQLVAIVLIAILFVAIIAQICVIVVLKTKTDDLSEKNDDVTLECVIDAPSCLDTEIVNQNLEILFKN